MVDTLSRVCVCVSWYNQFYLVSSKKEKKMKEEALNVLVSCHNK